MFWGLTLEHGKHYSQTVEDSFHISMAALELDISITAKRFKSPVRVMVQHDKKEFLLCSLIDRKFAQQTLDLDFTEGEQVKFYLEGKGVVHLTGSLIQEGPFGSDEELILNSPPDSEEDGMELTDDSDENDDDVPSLQHLVTGDDEDSSDEDCEEWTPDQFGKNKKRKLQENTIPQLKKLKKAESSPTTRKEDDEDSDDEQEEDSGDDTAEMADLMEDIDVHAQNGKVRSTPVSKEKVEAVAGETEASPTKKKRKKKKKSKEGSKQQDGKLEGASPGNDKTEGSKPGERIQTATPAGSAKKSNKKENKAKTPVQITLKRRKLSNGVIVEDTVLGEGKIAKINKMVGVYYKGALSKSKKEFDSCISGKPFQFRLGKKEVISGWDAGLQGMRVGGKRKLVIPPSQGYGNERMGDIPPNSTLLFEVELKNVQ